MSKNKKTGDWGEEQAMNFLEGKEFEVLTRNYRHSRGEIDIIAKKEDLLVFVEVKTRSGTYYGYPEDWVDERKEKWIREVADHYIHETDWQNAIRFDIIAIVKGNPPEIRHLEDVF